MEDLCDHCLGHRAGGGIGFPGVVSKQVVVADEHLVARQSRFEGVGRRDANPVNPGYGPQVVELLFCPSGMAIQALAPGPF